MQLWHVSQTVKQSIKKYHNKSIQASVLVYRVKPM